MCDFWTYQRESKVCQEATNSWFSLNVEYILNLNPPAYDAFPWQTVPMTCTTAFVRRDHNWHQGMLKWHTQCMNQLLTIDCARTTAELSLPGASKKNIHPMYVDTRARTCCVKGDVGTCITQVELIGSALLSNSPDSKSSPIDYLVFGTLVWEIYKHPKI